MTSNNANLSSPHIEGEPNPLGLGRQDNSSPEASGRWLEDEALSTKYAEMTENPETNPYEHMRTWPALIDMIPDNAQHIMDIGCGNGSFTHLLFDAFPNIQSVTGVDTDPYGIRYARNKYPPEHFDGKLSFHRWTAETPDTDSFVELPFPEKFDVVISKLAFDFIPLDPHTLRRISDTMKPGAQLLIAIHHPNRSARYAAKPGEDLPLHEAASYKTTIGADQELLVIRQHRPLEMYVEALRRVGMRVIQFKGLHSDPEMLKGLGLDPNDTSPRRIILHFRKKT